MQERECFTKIKEWLENSQGRKKLGLRKESKSQTPWQSSLSISNRCFSIHICFIPFSLTAHRFLLFPGPQGEKWLPAAAEFSSPLFKRTVKLRWERVSTPWAAGKRLTSAVWIRWPLPVQLSVAREQRHVYKLGVWKTTPMYRGWFPQSS